MSYAPVVSGMREVVAAMRTVFTRISALRALTLVSACDAHLYARPKLLVTDRWICAARDDATWCAVRRASGSSQAATALRVAADARVRVAGPAVRLGTRDFADVCVWEREDRRFCGEPTALLHDDSAMFSAPVGARLEPPWTLDERRRPPGDGDGYVCRGVARGVECSARRPEGSRGLDAYTGREDLLVEPIVPHPQEQRWQRHRSAIAALPSVYEVALSADTACVLFGRPRSVDGAFAMRCFDDRGAFDPALVALEITASRERICARTPHGVYCVGETGVLSASQSACPRVGSAVVVSGGPFRALHESLPCAITAGATAELRCWGRDASQSSSQPGWVSRVQPLLAPPVAFAARDGWVETANAAWAAIELDPRTSFPPTEAEQSGRRSVSASLRCELADTTITCWPREALARAPWTLRVERPASRIGLRAETLCALFDDGAASCWNVRSRQRLHFQGSIALQSDGAVCRYDERGRVECAWIGEGATADTLVWAQLAERGARYVLSRAGRRCFIADDGAARCAVDGASRRLFAGLDARVTSLSMGVDWVCGLIADGRIVCEGQPGLCDDDARVQVSRRAFVPVGL
jgi:hypothetical protein